MIGGPTAADLRGAWTPSAAADVLPDLLQVESNSPRVGRYPIVLYPTKAGPTATRRLADSSDRRCPFREALVLEEDEAHVESVST